MKRARAITVTLVTVALTGAFGATTVGAAAEKPSVLCWNKSYPGPYNTSDAQVRVKPKRCLFFQQGGTASYQSAGVVSLNWKAWGGSRAKGRGTRTGNMGFQTPTNVRLTKPVRNCDGDLVFSKAKFKSEELGSGGFRLYTCPRQAPAKDFPGTDGGPADRGCKPVIESRYYVGATKMACSNARRVAKRGIRGNPQRPKWNCTGVGTGFGHCHGRDGRIAHWAVND